MINPTPRLVALGIALTVATVILNEMFVVTTSEMQATMQSAEQWCHAQNGTLEIARVIGEHGGLHCRLPDGTLVEYK